MLAAPVLDMSAPSDRRRFKAVPLVLSALVHLALAIAWLGFPIPRIKDPEPPSVAVELVPPPAQKPAPPADQGGAKPQPEKDGRAIPQLEQGELAQRSSPAPAKESTAPSAVVAKPAEKLAAVKKPIPVTQNERDFVLSQVVRQWKPPKELAAYDQADMRVSVTVRPDGYFAEIYDSRRPWNPDEVFDGYSQLHPQSIQRRTIDALYRAIRQAQPLKLPEALKAKAPFAVRLDLRFKDAR
ncbi:conserved hypothetical protein [Magnetospirillum sp. LM-5]|nr:conserved hypothetical protein [Magnetospirillum sp. LM-5]